MSILSRICCLFVCVTVCCGSVANAAVDVRVGALIARYLANLSNRNDRLICGNENGAEVARIHRVQNAFASELYALGPATIPAVVQMLSGNDQLVGVLAKDVLLMHGTTASRPLLNAVELSTSQAPSFPSMSAEIFNSYGLDEQSLIVNELLRSKGGSQELKWRVVSLIGRPKSSNQFPNKLGQALANNSGMILKMVLEGSPSMRESAIYLMPLCGAHLDKKNAVIASDYLVHALSDSDFVVKSEAISALGYFNFVSPTALAALNNLVQDKNTTIADGAECAIVGLCVKNKEYSPAALLNGLRGDERQRIETLRWISHLEASGAPLAPGLISFYQQRVCSDSEARCLATAFKNIGYTRLPAVRALEKIRL